MRDMLFVGHANPEDNEIARWLALRLATEGYPVWCDLTKLLGGEAFWSDIESAIRERTSKYLLVLSRTSNAKPGVLNELSLAQAVQRSQRIKDFVVPLWIDDLPASEFNIHLHRINAIPFQDGWHRGLARLLEKLEEDGVPKRPDFGPQAVASWWRERVSASYGLRQSPELLVTNWYKLRPITLHFHKLGLRLTNSAIEPASEIPYPAERFGDYIVTFAPAEDIRDTLGSNMMIASSEERWINPNEPEQRPRMWSYKDERSIVTKLLNRAWREMLIQRELPLYQFADGPPSFYFTKDMVDRDRVRFEAAHGHRTFRNVVGVKTIRGRSGSTSIRYWHFALEARPLVGPVVGFTMKPHVLFSDDGRSIWDNKDRLARARRSQCKDWWNADWRDRNFAAVHFLADGGETIRLQVASKRWLEVEARPLYLTSPASYDEAALSEDPDAEFALDMPEEDEFDDEEEA